MPPRAKGNYTIKKLTARRRVTAETESYEIPYVGPFAALSAAVPPVGSAVAGYPSDFRVDNVTLEETGGGSGRMVVTIIKSQPGTPGGDSPTPVGVPIYELDWAEERRPIFEHPHAPKLKEDRPRYKYPDRETSEANPAKTQEQVQSDSEEFYKKRSWDNWMSLDAADIDGASGGWSLSTLQKILNAGINDYPVAFPIASVTKYARARIAPTGSVNAKSNPPGECGAPTNDWFWIKTAARASKQGRLYSLVETWRGYHKDSVEYGYIFAG